MSTVNEMAESVVHVLADGATDPTGSPYATQASLMEAAGVQSEHTFNDVIKRAVQLVRVLYPGHGIFLNHIEGYRLLDAATALDKRTERGRLRAARTKMDRLTTTLGAESNSPVLHMVGHQLQTVIDTVIDPALTMIDSEIG